ncbi:hypothetical protein PR048_031602 [Dryococelus australis]|uniref:Uncharacterized protein n=1 Tax=Dryococelus australis TaxID=614101 RepID=A0ABQ9G6S3_9NEOP|nr:hypothetical protein PR048_031602 [Dryococelus australis]
MLNKKQDFSCPCKMLCKPLWLHVQEQQLTQAPELQNEPRRKHFAIEMLYQTDQNPNYLANVIFTQVATFHTSGKKSYHGVTCASENFKIPRMIRNIRTGFVPDFRMQVSCWMMPLVGDFSRGSPFHFDATPHSPRSTLIGSQDLDVKSCLNISIYSFQQDCGTMYWSFMAARLWAERPHTGGPTGWPPRSPDINTLDFFLLSHFYVDRTRNSFTSTTGWHFPLAWNHRAERLLTFQQRGDALRSPVPSEIEGLAEIGPPSTSHELRASEARVPGDYYRGNGRAHLSQLANADDREDKINAKHVYTEVAFAIGPQFIRHSLDDSEPIADLQGNKERVPYRQVWNNTGCLWGRLMEAIDRRNDCTPIIALRVEENYVRAVITSAFRQLHTLQGLGTVTSGELTHPFCVLPLMLAGRGNTTRPASCSPISAHCLCPVAPSWFEISIRDRGWTGDRHEVHFQPPELENHEILLVQHYYIGNKIKLDPGPELESFDLGSDVKFLLIPLSRFCDSVTLGCFLKDGHLNAGSGSKSYLRAVIGSAQSEIEFNFAFERCIPCCSSGLRYDRNTPQTSFPFSVSGSFLLLPLTRARKHRCTYEHPRNVFPSCGPTLFTTDWGSGGRAVSMLASHQGEPGFDPPDGPLPDLRKWESCRTMPLVGGFSRGSSAYPQLFRSGGAPFSPQSPSSALKTSLLRAAQISSLTDSPRLVVPQNTRTQIQFRDWVILTAMHCTCLTAYHEHLLSEVPDYDSPGQAGARRVDASFHDRPDYREGHRHGYVRPSSAQLETPSGIMFQAETVQRRYKEIRRAVFIT